MTPHQPPGRASVLTLNHSNSCRTVDGCGGLRKADFMAPGAWSVATELQSSLNQSLAVQAPGSRICLIRGTTLAFSLMPEGQERCKFSVNNGDLG